MRCALLAPMLLASACMSELVPAHQEAPPLDDMQLSEMLARGDFRGGDYVRVNPEPFTSQLPANPEPQINVYVSNSALAVYAHISPDATGSHVEFPAGALVVREVLLNGVVQKLTVMQRRAPGWYPAGGDFLYAVTDLTGAPIDDAHGAAQWGPLDSCVTCHAPRSGDSFLFGVPDRDRIPALR
jgi:hypothetical protein